MRTRTMLSLMLSSALACSGSDPSPTELRPDFATACSTPKPKITASPSAVTRAPNTAGSVKFIVTNPCTATLEDWSLTTSRTGSVTSVGAPSLATISVLGPDQSVNVFVSYSVGSPGTGTVVLTARSETGTTAFGYQAVTVAQAATGVPFGPFDLFKTSTMPNGQLAPFNLTLDFSFPQGIIGQIKSARDNHIRLVTQMAGGAHSNYTDSNGKFVFAKWKAAMDSFNDGPNGPIVKAVADGVADGTILFNSLMDEPNHPTWGGVPTHALLDSMSRHAKSIFPTLKTGVVVDWKWEKDSVYQSVDVIVSQYWMTSRMTAKAYRDSAVASAKNRQKVGLMFSMNILHGGAVAAGTPMTAAQVRAFGDTLLGTPDACGLTMWRWDAAYIANTANIQAAFNHLADTAAVHAAKACVRP